jgi:transposase
MRKAANHAPAYPPEFRAEAIRLARTSGKPRSEIARDLGMTAETLRLWVKQADLDEGKRSDGLTSDEQEELRRLRREVRILREEREILKKVSMSRCDIPSDENGIAIIAAIIARAEQGAARSARRGEESVWVLC